MASPSVSFRISRSAEDLAGTLHLLSQRLVQFEQRLSALEGQRETTQEDDPDLVKSLGNAERLLLDCRALLGGALDEGTDASASHQSPEEGGNLADHDPLIDGSLAPLFQHDSPDSFAA